MKAIIFGSRGQDGIYLSALLKEKKYEIILVDRKEDQSTSKLNDFNSVCELVKTHQPAFIFHLAANSTTSHTAWLENHETISTGTLYILEAVKAYSPATKVFLSGSGLQFKNEGRPIKETDEFYADSIYSVSRIHTVYAARYYRTLGLKVYMGYFFNHDSPYRTERHINKKILAVVKRIAEGSQEKLPIGDLSVKKEFGFAGDIVKGIWAFASQDALFECVIGTGVAHTIEEWVDISFSLYNLDWRKYVTPLPGFTSGYKILVSDPTTIFSFGWRPETGIHQLAKMMQL